MLLSPTGGKRRSTRALRWRCRQRQIQDRDALLRLAARADGGDLAVLGQIHACDGDVQPKHHGLERHGEILLEHRVKACDALAFVVAVDGRFGDQGIQHRPFGSAHMASLSCRSVNASRFHSRSDNPKPADGAP